MEAKNQLKILYTIRKVVTGLLFVLAILLLIFSFISGTENYGGGLQGFVQNSPNSLPWLLLLILLFFVKRKPIWTASLLILFGAFITYFFNFTGQNFFLSTFVLCLSIIFLGFVLLFTGLAIKQHQRNASSENS